MTFFETEFRFKSHEVTEDELERIEEILKNMIGDDEPEDKMIKKKKNITNIGLSFTQSLYEKMYP